MDLMQTAQTFEPTPTHWGTMFPNGTLQQTKIKVESKASKVDPGGHGVLYQLIRGLMDARDRKHGHVNQHKKKHTYTAVLLARLPCHGGSGASIAPSKGRNEAARA
ncbi:hypothetical protein MUK42_06456 [Musa troglodytarum]|uniref:Uncharacterized protein n=1 Tax=Musa troglodytarum TaxID=320322 RepID=A0A9E7F7F2_9LILI|nr:hypothetical protein MUK42_06456 [Musa troglodytarum]